MNYDYKTVRRDRLVDLVGDYLSDEDTTPDQFYTEILEEVKSWVDYHEKHAAKCNALYVKLHGLAK